MAIVTNILGSISIALLIVTAAFLLFIRAHTRAYPSNRDVSSWSRGRKIA